MKSKLGDVATLAVRCPNWVGDVVMATPVFECLRRNLPQTRIVGVLRQSTQGVVKDSPWFDALVDASDKTWAGLRQMRRQLRALSPEAAILLTNSVRSALTLRLCGIRRLYGYARQGRRVLLAGGPRAARNGEATPVAMGHYYLEICRWLGLDVPAQPRSMLFIGEDLRRRGEALLARFGIAERDFLVGLTPGASFGSSKCWPPEYFAQLADLCRSHFHAKVILFCGPGEEDISRAIREQAKVDILDARAAGVDLETLKPLVQRCNLFITNDTGPRHYAVAFEVPIVVLMGPTDPRYTNLGLERTIVLRKELDCSPCHKKICPRQQECMRAIQPAEVLAAAERLLNGGK
jgi:heptosyltransferase-2